MLVAALLPIIYYCDKTEFPQVKSYIRDALQFLNNANEADKSFITVNINGKVDTFERPLSLDVFTSVINKLMSFNPKNIILCFSSKEIMGDKIKQNLLKYLTDKKNIYMQSDFMNPELDIARNEILKKYERILYFSSSKDQTQGARDLKPRRILIKYDKQGLADEYDVLQALGYPAKNPEYYKYSFRVWETDQIYMKNYPEGTFGSFNAVDVLSEKIPPQVFEGKTIILGTFDEYSFSALPSVFNFSDKITGKNFKSYFFPHSDHLANILSAFTTGKYMKVPKSFNDLVMTFILLILLILSRITLKNKLILFTTFIPLCFFITFAAYGFTSFFLDFSKSIVLVFFLQYLGIPIIVFSMFKEQESKKLQEINDARIDALLTVSEKVAHDIRSPLSVINLIIDKAKFDDPEFKEIFNQAVGRIEETATKILTRYRTKTGSESETTELIDLENICSTIIKEKKVLNANIIFELTLNGNSKMAMGLKLDLERIVSNIIDNSIFALSKIEKPEIRISLNTHNEFVQLSIIDNGVGIPEQILKLLGSARVTTKAETGQGNGIGLLHAKRVIERLNGKFEISSQENIGTTIKISLPKA